MKIYLTNYDLSKRADKTIYASQYSSFKAGIKVPGASDVKLYDGQTEISADASLFHGYKAFPLDAGDAGQKEYTVKADGSELKLKVVATDSTAAELNDKDTVFDLPIATATTLGGVKVGEGLAVAADGTLSASGGQLPSDISANSLTAGSALYAPGISATTELDSADQPVQHVVLGDPNSPHYVDWNEQFDTFEIGCEDLTANSVDVGDSINLGNKITMGKSTSGGYINLGQDSKIQAVGPNNLCTTLSNDGLVITDNDITINCNMTNGFSFSDSTDSVEITNTDIVARDSNGQSTRMTASGVYVSAGSSGATAECTTTGIYLAGGGNHNSIDNNGMVVEDTQSNQAQVYPTSIEVRDSNGNYSTVTAGTVYVTGNSGA